MGEAINVREKTLLATTFLLIALIVFGVLGVNKFDRAGGLLVALIALAVVPLVFAYLTPVSDGVYFFCAILTSVGLSLIYPLRGPILGRDAPLELHTLREVMESGIWDPQYFEPVGPLLYNPLMAIFHEVLAVELFPLYRSVASFLAVLIVAGSFVLFNRYFAGRQAYLLAVFIAFQYNLLRAGLGNVRETLAMLFFVFLVYSLIHKTGRVLPLILVVATVLSYYSSAVFLLAFLTLALAYFVSHRPESVWWTKEAETLALSLLATGVISITWLLYAGGLVHVVTHLHRMVPSVEDLLAIVHIFESDPSSSSSGSSILLADLFNYAVVMGTVGVAALGSVKVLLNDRDSEELTDSLLFSALFLSVAAIAIPIFADSSVSMYRIYQYSMFLLALGIPVAIVWGLRKVEATGFPHNLSRYAIILVAVLVSLQLLVFSGFVYQVQGEGPELVWFDDSGEQETIWEVERSERAQTQFILTYGNPDLVIHGDRYVDHRTLPFVSRDDNTVNREFFVGERWRTKEGYIYLRSQTVNQGVVAPQGTGHADFEPVSAHPYVARSDSVYRNGGAELRRYHPSE